MSDHVPIAAPTVSAAAREAVDDVLASGMLADGEQVRAFEDEFADFVGTEHAVATSSGTTALHAMLEAAGIGEGDAVLTTPFSFIATANAVVHAGAEPVFADVEETTGNLDPDDAARILDDRSDIAAIMPVHLYGHPARMDRFRALAERYGCRLLEDAAQAHGAALDGERAGALGEAAAFSFYPTKNMTTGEGGMITTDDDEIADRARRLIDHGRTDRYRHDVIGYNYRMTNIAAAIGREQLERLPDWLDERRDHAERLAASLADGSELQAMSMGGGAVTHAHHQFTVRAGDRDALLDRLDEAGVGYGIYYPLPLPDQPVYRDADPDVPVARSLADDVVSVPVHHGLSDDELGRVASVLGGT